MGELVPGHDMRAILGQLTQRQEEFSIHLSQALSYLHSRHHHLKAWAALFLGDWGCPDSRTPHAYPT